MATLFLLLIYLAFISLGLPDPMLGAAWPVMRAQMNVGLEGAGWLSMVISSGTIISSLASARVAGRFGTGRVTTASVLATAVALVGYGFAPSYGWLIAFSVPLGLGAGAVDAALNNYVALHYEAKHMSWLHCFWGVGALAGPLVMSVWLDRGGQWRGGYFTVGAIQFFVFLALLFSLPLWGRQNGAALAAKPESPDIPSAPAAGSAGSTLAIPGVKAALATFFMYCAVEWTAGLWAASYLVEIRDFSEIGAARGAAAFFAGITGGRFVNGFLTRHFSGAMLIRAGVLTIIAGGALAALPLPGPAAFMGLVLVGLGCAPVYPSMIHETPRRFGAANSPTIIGWQMATAYAGTTIFPPLLGWIAGRTGLWIFPYALLGVGLAMLLCSEHIERCCRNAARSESSGAGAGCRFD